MKVQTGFTTRLIVVLLSIRAKGGGRQPKVIRKIKVVAMRGREGGATVRATERWNEQHNNNGNKG